MPILILSLAFSVVAAPPAANAQQAGKVPRLGILSPGSPGPSPLLEAFRQGLRELGYVEARNIVIEWRFAEGRSDRLPDMAAELVRLKVDVIFAMNTPAGQAAKNATGMIPIVMTRVSDPVRIGLVASLAQPGGNVTGLTTISDELSGKRLELLKEALPPASRVALLWNSANTGHAITVNEMEAAAPQLGMQLKILGVRWPKEFQNAFTVATKWGASALMVIDDLMIASHQAQILDLAAKNKLPVISQFREFAEAGGLMAYGPNNDEMFRRAAVYVDKILKGAKPADLPVEQPTKFELVINLKTAKALGLTIPQSILVRADQVIQ